MNGMDLFDDIGGNLDFFDWIESWVTFALMPQSQKGKRLGRLNLVQYSIPRADKMEGQGKRAVNLHETMEYLKRFGIIVKCNGFDSQRMYFQIRKNQQKWADTLLDVDADGIPRLDYARMNWDEKAKARKAAQLRRSRWENASWLENWKSLFR